LSKAVTIKVCKMMVKPVVVQGGDTGPVTETDMKAWVHGRGKRINGPVVVEGIWRIRTNQEMSYIKI